MEYTILETATVNEFILKGRREVPSGKTHTVYLVKFAEIQPRKIKYTYCHQDELDSYATKTTPYHGLGFRTEPSARKSFSAMVSENRRMTTCGR